ncbi:unnamed protein product [Arctia plantaginis]|uniref:CCHC-type domain-containing protein n=1 Tax=Arctia plantaginis TaxID=874455 RepID=A0A8S1B782_ARCPL|nr:unnamed protein product [Arctia plantaginis]
MWGDFKSLFLSRDDCVDKPAATLVKMMSSKPKEGECYAAYAARCGNAGHFATECPRGNSGGAGAAGGACSSGAVPAAAVE